MPTLHRRRQRHGSAVTLDPVGVTPTEAALVPGTSNLPVRLLSHRRLRLASAVLAAAAIFLVDLLTPLQGAVAVLYVVVLVLVFGLDGRLGIAIAAAACAGLTLAAHLLAYGFDGTNSSILRCVVSLAAIATTAWLLMHRQDSVDALARQAGILDLTHDAIFLKRLDGRISYWNRGAERLYGWSTRDALGQASGDLLQTRFPVGREAAVELLLQTGRWEGEVIQTARNGRHLIAACRWALLRDAKGAPSAIVETDTDITDRLTAERALLQTQKDLAHAGRVATVSALTTTLAHEINQPLAAIVTNTNAALRWLRRPEPELGEVEAALERTRASGDRAAAIVNQARNFLARRDSTVEPIDAAEAIREALLLVERELRDHAMTLRVHLPAGLPQVRADRVQLQQVIVNLVLNATHAMAQVPPLRRVLTIRASRDTPGHLLVEVEDQGPGIAPDFLPRLFAPFESRRKGGMGLGLAICRAAIEASGGVLSAKSEAGHGATFRFTLPAEPQEAAA